MCQTLDTMGEGQHEPPLEGSAAEGRELIYWIAQAAKRVRNASGTSEAMIAAIADVDPATIKRFERVERFPKELDQIMIAYARVAGLTDERDIYELGFRMWRESHPSAMERFSDAESPLAPLMPSGRARPSQTIAQLVEETAKRQARAGSQRKSGRSTSATRSRRAAR